MPKKENVRVMFDNIAGDYDKLNHIMSLDVDKMWRRKALKQIVIPGEKQKVLDLACGTGDFSIAIARRMQSLDNQGSSVVGADLSEGMLAVMKEKVAKLGLDKVISVEEGDGENLRFGDDSFDRVSIGFGIRNFEDKEKGLREMLRVLRPGGKLVILELSEPENPVIKWFYELYFLHVMPWIGGAISGEKGAYKYLPASVVRFPKHKEFEAMMADCGFTDVRHKALTFGLCRMFVGTKPRQ